MGVDAFGLNNLIGAFAVPLHSPGCCKREAGFPRLRTPDCVELGAPSGAGGDVSRDGSRMTALNWPFYLHCVAPRRVSFRGR
jgi:hypothetical protein